jgi:hypothetical protein
LIRKASGGAGHLMTPNGCHDKELTFGSEACENLRYLYDFPPTFT